MVYLTQNADFVKWVTAYTNVFKKICLQRKPPYIQVGILLYCHIQSQLGVYIMLIKCA
jgi:hypothetical protein